nr:hypothetical protein [Amylibacter sp.]
MLRKSLDWIGLRANLFVTVLAVLVAVNVPFQVYLHKTTPLLAWKGGGFGMYTEPHAEDRAVWLHLEGKDGTAFVQLWPETPAFVEWREAARVSGGAYLAALTKNAERFRFYPRDVQAARLINQLSRVRWPEALIGQVTPESDSVFKPDRLTLEVYENRFDLESNTVTRESVFKYSGVRAE